MRQSEQPLDIMEVLEEMAALADQIQDTVCRTFNGISIRYSPMDSTPDLYEKYMGDLDREWSRRGLTAPIVH